MMNAIENRFSGKKYNKLIPAIDRTKYCNYDSAPVLFYKISGPHGYMSNFYYSPFTVNLKDLPRELLSSIVLSMPFIQELENKNFSCNEAAIMYAKAALFSRAYNCKLSNREIMDRILQLDSENFDLRRDADMHRDAEKHNSDIPKQIKVLGRSVEGFDNSTWCDVVRDIAVIIDYFKFTQNNNLLIKLMMTNDSPIGEASPNDLQWGIGDNIANAPHVRKWSEHSNICGDAKMIVRTVIKRSQNLGVAPPKPHA